MCATSVRILMLEDEAIIGMMMTQILERAGFGDICHVMTVKDALLELQRGDVGLCLFDVALESGTSAEAIAEANRQHIPVILSTGNPDVGGLDTVPDNFVFLEKPTPPEMLVGVVQRMLCCADSGQCA